MTATWLAIVNAHAGYSRSSHWRTTIAETLRRQLGAEVVFTEYPGHATELARSAKAPGIAVFGGDGTVAAVVNGMGLEEQQLLVLPGGTGNGLARDLGLTSLDKCFDAARGNRSRRLDLIRVNARAQDGVESRLAISTASVGYAAEAVVLANAYFKGLGNWCYPVAATVQAARQPVFPLSVSIDDHEFVGQYLSNVLINNTQHAGNFHAFRGSDLADGRMEVLLARAGFARQLLHNLAVLTKTYFYSTAYEVSIGKLKLTLTSPRRLMIDGEILENVSEAEFEVLPRTLRCVV